MEFQVKYLAYFFFSSQEYPVNAVVAKGSIVGPTLFQQYINDLPDDVICDIATYADDTEGCNQLLKRGGGVIYCDKGALYDNTSLKVVETLWPTMVG